MKRPCGVSILGGGGFGRGLATAAARLDRDVLLWSRQPRDFDFERVRVTSDLSEIAQSELIFVAVPSSVVASIATELGPFLDGRHYLVHVSRGLIGDELHPISRVLRERTPAHRVGALAGPLVAEALAEGTPSGAIVGTRFSEVVDAVRDAIGSPTLRIYNTQDIVGVEVASAMVGLLAVSIGYARKAGLDGATLAMFLTRGMAEAARLVPVWGADPQTLFGLAGYGDLLAVVAGDTRPEIRLGEALADGQSLEVAGRVAGAHIEGVSIAQRLVAYVERHRLDAPMVRAMLGVLEGEPAEEVASMLMARQVGSE